MPFTRLPHMWSSIAKLVVLLLCAWPGMLLSHEFGHILGGWLSGGMLKDYDLHPWRLPFSIHDPDPHPLFTLWSGPIFGVIAPLIAALLIRRRWSWFIADFCILANGLYLAASWASGDQYLDTTQLLAKGAHPSSILLYCAVTIPVGYLRFRRDCLAIFALQKLKQRERLANKDTKGTSVSKPNQP